MRLVLVALAFGGVWGATARLRRPLVGDRIAAFLDPPVDDSIGVSIFPPQLAAGLPWSKSELAARRLIAAAAGAMAGALLGQGDLFVSPSSSALALILLGGAAGAIAISMWLSSRRQSRAGQLLIELPTIVDAIALHLLAGSSVETAVESVAQEEGVGAFEMRAALSTLETGLSLTEALRALGPHSARDDSGRLYTFLAEANVSGGRLTEGLAMLAKDYRAASERALTAEGGRRAIAAYGPILALMVPVTLLFLMYPTIAGLRNLAGG
ncbi:MAG: type II secretion system F family protein [Acidimicrobiia bacterium]|nr:type II secretion system F family protein [Acidimicrobiia bacterium]